MVSTTELYNLRWNSYFSNLITSFSNHQNLETLVDVTVSCEGKFIKAHRLVLSACSVYFQKMFEVNTAPQLLILLNDVKFKDLELVIQFMYKGEVKVADSEMQSFLSLGKMLQVKGLCSVELQNKQKSLSVNNGNAKLTEVSLAESTSTHTEVKTTSNSTKVEVQEKEVSPVLKKRKQPSPVLGENASKLQKKNIKPPSGDNQDMSHIPRPPNAFMIFANQWRKKLAVEYPGESNKDISVRLGNMWKSLSQDTKDAFYEDAKRADEEHKLKYPGSYRYYYSPKEARKRKAIANISKTAQTHDTTCSVEIRDSIDDELIEIKSEGPDVEEFPGHSSQSNNGSRQ